MYINDQQTMIERSTQQNEVEDTDLQQNTDHRNFEKSILSDAMTMFSKQMEKMQSNHDKSIQMFTEYMNSSRELKVKTKPDNTAFYCKNCSTAIIKDTEEIKVQNFNLDHPFRNS